MCNLKAQKFMYFFKCISYTKIFKQKNTINFKNKKSSLMTLFDLKKETYINPVSMHPPSYATPLHATAILSVPFE